MVAIISQMSLFLLSFPINVRIFVKYDSICLKLLVLHFFSQMQSLCWKHDDNVWKFLKCKRSLFRSQCCMRPFMWFSNTVTILNILCPMAKLIVFTWYLTSTFSPNAKITSNRWQLDFKPRRSIIFDFLICLSFSWIGVVRQNANKGQ